MAVADMISRMQRIVDRVVSPETRSGFYENVWAFFQEQPILATFFLSTLTISLPPLLFFLTFTLSVLTFSLVAAIIFSLFWIGVALLLLVPTLFVTVGLGVIIWVWAISSWVLTKWIYGMLPATKGEVKGQVNGKKVFIKKEEGDFMPHGGEVRNGF
ncbi:hypothetical protein ACMFMG_011351 [Clarireedia jacksonii]